MKWKQDFKPQYFLLVCSVKIFHFGSSFYAIKNNNSSFCLSSEWMNKVSLFCFKNVIFILFNFLISYNSNTKLRIQREYVLQFSDILFFLKFYLNSSWNFYPQPVSSPHKIKNLLGFNFLKLFLPHLLLCCINK